WASTLVVVLFMGSVQLISLGIIGEYIRLIFLEAKRRPTYIVRAARAGAAAAGPPPARPAPAAAREGGDERQVVWGGRGRQHVRGHPGGPGRGHPPAPLVAGPLGADPDPAAAARGPAAGPGARRRLRLGDDARGPGGPRLPRGRRRHLPAGPGAARP